MVYYYYGTTEGDYGPSSKSKIRKSSTLKNALRGCYAMIQYGSWNDCYIVPNNRYTKRNAIAYVDTDGYGKNVRVIAIKNGKWNVVKSDGSLGERIR